MEIRQLQSTLGELKSFWSQRNNKFKDWYSLLTMVDTLYAKGMESYVSNEPLTFYNMAHYLLTRGELTHYVPVVGENALELDRRARVDRACKYMWSLIGSQHSGNIPFMDELGFYLLVLGWYSLVAAFDPETGKIQVRLWNPAEVYPNFANNRLTFCAHSYTVTEDEVRLKAEENNWDYQGRTMFGTATLDDCFIIDSKGNLQNIVLVDGKDVTGWQSRENMFILVSPVAGFPDRGAITPSSKNYKHLMGRGIFEVTEEVTLAMNKWKSIISQILRDTAQPITEEFSATPQANPEQLRERGALFHYAQGEQGLVRLPPPSIPIELQAHLVELRREIQKGSFSDAVYGMIEGKSGYALSLLSTSSANQILYPYMDAKHFVVSQCDKFWLSNLKTSRRVFEIKGKFVEKLKPIDIPEDVEVIVDSDVATPKDWLERGTVANMLKEHLDNDTIVTDILKIPDAQAVKRRKTLDRMFEHPMTQMIEMITSYKNHAKYLQLRGDIEQATLFRKAAEALETQLAVPPAGAGKPAEETAAIAARQRGAPAPRTRVPSRVSPPEAQGGFTPAELRESIGRGTVRR